MCACVGACVFVCVCDTVLVAIMYIKYVCMYVTLSLSVYTYMCTLCNISRNRVHNVSIDV